MELNDKIFIAGHNGLVGSAILRQLISRGFKNLITTIPYTGKGNHEQTYPINGYISSIDLIRPDQCNGYG